MSKQDEKNTPLHQRIKRLIAKPGRDYITTSSKMVIAFTPPIAGAEKPIYRLRLSRRNGTVGQFDGDTVWAHTKKAFSKGQLFSLETFAFDLEGEGTFIIEWRYLEQVEMFSRSPAASATSGYEHG